MSLRSLFFIALGVLAVGCNKPSNRFDFPFCSAVGVVTLDGTPLASGALNFVPAVSEHKGGRPGVCSIGSDGSYSVGKTDFGRSSPLPPGEYVVTVLAMQVDAEAGKPTPHLAVPQIYTDYRTSPIRATLAEGENRIDVKLVR